MNLKQFVCFAICVFSLMSCKNRYNEPLIEAKHIGTIAGTVAGGVAGSQIGKGVGRTAATTGGTLLGAYLGQQLGTMLDQSDYAYYDDASQTALEDSQTGIVTSWRNPDTSNFGTITPTRTYKDASGRYCREYNQTVTVKSDTSQAYGTACREPDGRWQNIQ